MKKIMKSIHWFFGVIFGGTILEIVLKIRKLLEFVELGVFDYVILVLIGLSFGMILFHQIFYKESK